MFASSLFSIFITIFIIVVKVLALLYSHRVCFIFIVKVNAFAYIFLSNARHHQQERGYLFAGCNLDLMQNRTRKEAIIESKEAGPVTFVI